MSPVGPPEPAVIDPVVAAMATTRLSQKPSLAPVLRALPGHRPPSPACRIAVRGAIVAGPPPAGVTVPSTVTTWADWVRLNPLVFTSVGVSVIVSLNVPGVLVSSETLPAAVDVPAARPLNPVNPLLMNGPLFEML